MNTVGIVGQGFVGTAMREVIRKTFKVCSYDLKYGEKCCFHTAEQDEMVPHYYPLMELYRNSDVLFLALPTPMNSDGSCNFNAIELTLRELDVIAKSYGKKSVVIKSTIPPGTTDYFSSIFSNLDICFSPEFLSELTAASDFQNQTDIILAGSLEGLRSVIEVFRKTNPQAVIRITTPAVAEMTKYMRNCFWAVNISFANEMKQICDAIGIEYSKVLEMAILDTRMNTKHWDVPGRTPVEGEFLPGFGGSCFPKDLRSLINKSYELKVDPIMMTAAWQKNEEVRPVKEWEKMIGRAVRK